MTTTQDQAWSAWSASMTEALRQLAVGAMNADREMRAFVAALQRPERRQSRRAERHRLRMMVPAHHR